MGGFKKFWENSQFLMLIINPGLSKKATFSDENVAVLIPYLAGVSLDGLVRNRFLEGENA